MYNPGSAQHLDKLASDSISKPIDSIHSSVQKINQAPLQTTRAKPLRNLADERSPRAQFNTSVTRTTTGQFTFGRNSGQNRLGQSYNPGNQGMKGILGVKKASLFKSPGPVRPSDPNAFLPPKLKSKLKEQQQVKMTNFQVPQPRNESPHDPHILVSQPNNMFQGVQRRAKASREDKKRGDAQAFNSPNEDIMLDSAVTLKDATKQQNLSAEDSIMH